MAADFYIAADYNAIRGEALPRLLTLESDAYYWFLYRYFESANLDRQHELIDLYGDNVLDGYQLDRLQDELKTALTDVNARPDTWDVLVGWKSEQVGRESEDWRPIERRRMVEIINSLLDLIRRAKESGLKLICVGD
jgi:hypothetical protein